MAQQLLQTEVKGWLHGVAQAWAAGADTWRAGTLTVRRVAGGANNAIYRVEADGRECAVKLCVADERKRALREYGLMRLLHAAELDVAPEPVCLDESCAIVPHPAVVYRWLPGTTLGSAPTAAQLAELLDSFQRLHSVQVGEFPDFPVPDAWFHWFDFEPYLSELEDLMGDYGPWLASTGPEGQTLYERLSRLVQGCVAALRRSEVDLGRKHVPLRLCRVDQNLGNAVWGDDARLRWVDWEYSGWGDPALDLAELRWHVALAELSEDQHAWLRENYRRPAGDATFEQRLALWDRLLVTRWPFLILRWLWSQHYGPDRVRLSQPAYDPAEKWARFVQYIDRAESSLCKNYTKT